MLDGADGRVLHTLADSALVRALGRPGVAPNSLTDRTPLGAEGIPYVHGSFELEGRCRGLLSGCTRLAVPERRRGEKPAGNMIVRFPD